MDFKSFNNLADDDLLTTDQVSDLLSIPYQTLTRWRNEGTVDLPYLRVGPKAIRYRKGAVVAFLDSCQQGQEAVNQ